MNQWVRYETKLDAFEGPLDLLLHFIREAKLDIHDIQISKLTAQYLAYIKAMEELHLDIASEYLVMAAHLMLIKSKKLLPKEDAEILDEDEEDPEAVLMRRLLEYQMYKASLDEFRKLEAERAQFYTKPAIDFSEYMEDPVKLNVNYDPSALILAFEKLWRRRQLERPLPTTIFSEKVTVNEQIEVIKTALRLNKRIKFNDLFTRCDKEYVVVTFLAMLEMAKIGEITLLQSELEDEIEIIEKGRLNEW